MDLPNQNEKALRHQHVDLEGGDADRAGQHLADDLAHGGVAPGRNPLVAVAFARQARQLEEGLGQAGHQHADGQAEDLLLQPAAHARGQQQHAGDHHHVEHHRPQRRHEEMAARVGHADEHRRQAHQQHVGKHQAQQPEHQLRLVVELPGTPAPGRCPAPPAPSPPRRRSPARRSPRWPSATSPASPSLTSFCLKMGMKAAVSAPSPSRRRKRLGTWKARTKALATAAVAHERRIDHLAHHAQHPAGQRRGGHRPGGFQHLRHRARSLRSKV